MRTLPYSQQTSASGKMRNWRTRPSRGATLFARVGGLLLLFACFAVTAYGVNNSPQGKIKHVIMVVQENRTPDNLFFANNVLVANGGDVRPTGNPPYGLCAIVPPEGSNTYQIPLTGIQLDPCWDTKHQHSDWAATYHSGAMDGACYASLKIPNGCTVPDCQPSLPDGCKCPAYTYVSNPTLGVVGTYFEIANKYGFANRFFQNNRGPSYPAHQFIFGGTSLPVPFSQSPTRYKWYAADNPVATGSGKIASCISPLGAKVSLINTDSVWPDCTQNPNDPQCMFPCLEHNTMADLFGTAVSWKYYINQSGKLWDAPAAVQHGCVLPTQQNPVSCDNPTYTNHVVIKPNGDHAAILTDIKGDGPNGCALANVSWVIPDGKWSDHAGRNQNNLNINRDYSFRVPFLVISAYNKHVTNGQMGFTGYISGTSNPTCPGQYCHDFGSILNFVEFVFGSNDQYLGTLSDQHSDYADALAPDAKPTCSTCDYSLSDFF